MDIARGEVQALRAGGRDDVRGVAGEEEAAEAQRLGDEAAPRRGALLDRRAGDERLRGGGTEAPAQLVPEARVGPFVELLGERALDVVAAAGAAAHAAQGEAARMVDVDQLLRHWRDVREHAEPAERVDLLVDLE